MLQVAEQVLEFFEETGGIDMLHVGGDEIFPLGSCDMCRFRA